MSSIPASISNLSPSSSHLSLDCVCDSSVNKPHNLTSSAFVIKRGTEKVYSSVLTFSGSCNNIGELRAICMCMEWVGKVIEKEKGKERVSSSYHILIRTDSEEALGMIHYPRQRESIKARESFLLLKSRVCYLSLIRVRREEVNLAHILAREGIRKEIEREERRKIEGYWKRTRMI